MRALATRKGRERAGRFLAEGIRVVEDLLASPLRIDWVASATSLVDSERGAALADAIDGRDILRRTLSDRDFNALAVTESPQGVLAVAEIPVVDIDTFPPDPSGASAVLVLDAVQDPGNFGTMVRSAEALGAEGVISLPGTVDPWNPKAIRSAAGSSFRVPIVQCEWGRAERVLRAGGFAILGAEVGGADIAGWRGRRAALVVGNEGAGLSTQVRDSLDASVGISLRGRAESLNVTAAAAILLHELIR